MEKKQFAEEIRRISGVDARKCMKCGKCSGTCPAFDSMDVHPHRFVSMIIDGDLDGLMQSKTLWTCLSCFACVERCPRCVEPARLIEAVRDMVVRQQGENHMNADDIPALLDDDLPQQAIVSAFRKYGK